MKYPDKIKFKIEKTGTGFSAFSEDYPVYTTGSTFRMIRKNCVEALNLYLDDNQHAVTEGDIQFEIDLRQFFFYYRVINAKFLARRIGMNATLLSQYVRGNKKPSPGQVQRILKGIQEIGKELADLEIVAKDRKLKKKNGT